MSREDDAISAEDIDDIIGIAQENKDEDDSRIDVDDVEDIAEELDIPAEYIRPAVDELAERRLVEQREQEIIQQRRQIQVARLRKSAIAIVVLLGSFALIGAAAVTHTQSSLAGPWAEVEQRRSRVESVMERQQHVQARVVNQPDDMQRQDALAGAENRVAIERRRYDQAASAYNAAVAGFPERALCGLAGVPCHAALADEVTEW